MEEFEKIEETYETYEIEESDAEYSRAKKRAMYILGAKAYSCAALKEKLLNNYSEKTANRVIKEMLRYGFLDDEAYAKRLSSALIKNKGYGVYRTKAEMRRKGVPENLISAALSQYETEDYIEELKNLIRKKYSHRLEDTGERRKTAAALARRGFGFSEIRKAIIDVLKETEED